MPLAEIQQLLAAGHREQAMEKLRAFTQTTDDADELHAAGDQWQALGNFENAVDCYRRALRPAPRVATLNNLAIALKKLGQPLAALQTFRQARATGPIPPSVLNNIGNLARQLGDLDESLAAYEACLAVRPGDADTLNNYAAALLDARRFDEAIAAYDAALASNPDHVAANGRLYALQFLPEMSAARLAAEHNAWGDRYAALADNRPYENDRNPDRRLRLGFVSPNFEHHSVGRFLLPLLQGIDRSKFEIFCYSDVARPDATTTAFQSAADQWRPIVGIDDAGAAAMIRDDRIDILIDLALHLSGTRLKLFARRPAPVQATYLAYCGPSGLAAMDYRLTDPYLDPPAAANPFRERPMRLAHSYWCYPPPPEAPAVAPPPSIEKGFVTFGCLNNFRKISPAALATWCELLTAVPHSRLIVHAHTGAHRDRLLAEVAGRGIDSNRVIFQGFTGFADYLASYTSIDIVLDTFPCNGGTTTCDALWMGVPVVTLAGDLPTARSGVSIMSNVGLPELIASSEAEYIRIAADLTDRPVELSQLRATMRDRMLASPLMRIDVFCQDFEAACRRMFLSCPSPSGRG